LCETELGSSPAARAYPSSLAIPESRGVSEDSRRRRGGMRRTLVSTLGSSPLVAGVTVLVGVCTVVEGQSTFDERDEMDAQLAWMAEMSLASSALSSDLTSPKASCRGYESVRVSQMTSMGTYDRGGLASDDNTHAGLSLDLRRNTSSILTRGDGNGWKCDSRSRTGHPSSCKERGGRQRAQWGQRRRQ
jgi:hypothetical protein